MVPQCPVEVLPRAPASRKAAGAYREHAYMSQVGCVQHEGGAGGHRSNVDELIMHMKHDVFQQKHT